MSFLTRWFGARTRRAESTGQAEVSTLLRQLQKLCLRGLSFDGLQGPPPAHRPARVVLDGQPLTVRLYEERTLLPRGGWWGRSPARILTLRAQWSAAGQTREHSWSVLCTPDGRVYRA